jgi:hypothetical protein
LAPSIPVAQNFAADAQLGELRISGGTLEVMLTHPTEPTSHSALYQKAIGVLIWLAFATIGIGALYACSKLAGDQRALHVR